LVTIALVFPAAGCAVDAGDPVVAEVDTSPGQQAVNPLGQAISCTVSQSTEEATAAAEILRLVNIERSQRSLPPLGGDSCLASVAKGYSVIMSNTAACQNATAQCTHNLDGTPTSRLDRANLGYTASGENMYTASPMSDPRVFARQAVAWWMSSAPHKANILGGFKFLGVGVTRRGDRLVATQDFANFKDAARVGTTSTGGAAIAYSSTTRKFGRAWGGGLATAEQNALKFCRDSGGSSCQSAVSRATGCVALAAGTSGAWGTGAGATLTEAMQLAQQWCARSTQGCKHVAAICANGSAQ
jgi:uncharacterized protein YkwD